MKKLFKLNIQLFSEPGGDGSGGTAGNDPGAQGGTQSQQTQIDYSKIEEMINKRNSQAQDNLLKGFLKQEGLTGEELNQAVNTFKQQKAAAEQQKIQESENIKLENQRLRAQILNSDIDSKLTALATAEGVSADKIPFLSKLIDRNGLADDKGNVLEDKVKEAMENVIKAFPDFKGTDQQNNNGFQQIGAGGNNDQQGGAPDQRLAAFQNGRIVLPKKIK
jgi:hypothetical protein